jgi:hypothetical protein
VQWLISVIPATWEVEIGKIAVRSQPGQKVSEHPYPTFQQGSQVWWCVPVISYSRGGVVQDWPGQKMRDPVCKLKVLEFEVQVVEDLLSKCKALSSKLHYQNLSDNNNKL